MTVIVHKDLRQCWNHVLTKCNYYLIIHTNKQLLEWMLQQPQSLIHNQCYSSIIMKNVSQRKIVIWIALIVICTSFNISKLYSFLTWASCYDPDRGVRFSQLQRSSICSILLRMLTSAKKWAGWADCSECSECLRTEQIKQIEQEKSHCVYRSQTWCFYDIMFNFINYHYRLLY